MRYMDSLRFITKKPGWFMNLVMCGLCMAIPMIGQIVLIGYMFEVFDALRRDKERQDYPLFEFNRFSPYLMRGIWVFIVQLIVQAVIGIPIGILYFVLMIIAAALAKQAGGLVAILYLVFFLLMMILSIVVGVFMKPMFIYAGVRQKFDFSGMIAFTKDFLRRALKETVLSLLFLMAWAMLIVPLGYCLCFVGILLTTSFVILAQHHLDYQLYELYLERGGRPIPEPEPKTIPPVPE